MSSSGYTAADLRRWKESTMLSDTQIKRFYDRFSKLDKGKKGRLYREDLLSIPSLTCNPLVDRVMAVIISNNATGIDFDSFIKAVSIFMSDASRDDKLYFTFQIYDMDGDGRISNKDLYEALRVMVGTNLTGAQLQQITDKTFIEADVNRDGYITFEEFKALTVNSDFADRMTLHF